MNIHEAKTQLSKLVDRAAKGEPFIIAKAGKPLVKVTALEENELYGIQESQIPPGKVLYGNPNPPSAT